MSTILRNCCMCVFAVLATGPHGHAMDARTMIDRWAEAMGGREILSTVQNFHAEYWTYVGGTAGTISIWQRSDGARRTVFTLGDALTETTIFDGQVMYRSENNGPYREVSGAGLAGEYTVAYMDSYSLFLDGRMPAHADAAVTGVSDSSVTLEVYPVEDHVIRYFFSRHPYPDSSEEVVAGQREVIVYTERVEEHGILWRSRAELYSGPSRFNVKVMLNTVDVNVDLDSTLFAPPGEWDSRAQFPEGKTDVTLPIDIYGHDLLVPVTLNDLPTVHQFVFDTGHEMTMLNGDRLAAMGLNLETFGSAQAIGSGGGTIEVTFAQVSLRIGGISFSDLTVVIIPLDALTPAIGRPIEGIIGGDVLAELVATVDYPNSELTLTRLEAYVPPANLSPIPLIFERRVPLVSLTFRTHDGREITGDFILGTSKRGGVSLSRLPTKDFMTVTQSTGTVDAPSEYGLGGLVISTFLRVPELSFGPNTIPSALIGIRQSAAYDEFASGPLGALGFECLKNFKVTLDYRREELWLENAVDSLDFGELDALGGELILAEAGSQHPGFAISHIIADSPAERAGLVVGDRIIQVNGRAAGEYSLPEVRELFKSTVDVSIQLTISRNGDIMDKEIRLKRMI